MNVASVPCLRCHKATRITRGQAKALPRRVDGSFILFCSSACQRDYIREVGEKEKRAAVKLHAENLGMDVEDLPI